MNKLKQFRIRSIFLRFLRSQMREQSLLSNLGKNSLKKNRKMYLFHFLLQIWSLFYLNHFKNIKRKNLNFKIRKPQKMNQSQFQDWAIYIENRLIHQNLLKIKIRYRKSLNPLFQLTKSKEVKMLLRANLVTKKILLKKNLSLFWEKTISMLLINLHLNLFKKGSQSAMSQIQSLTKNPRLSLLRVNLLNSTLMKQMKMILKKK